MNKRYFFLAACVAGLCGGSSFAMLQNNNAILFASICLNKGRQGDNLKELNIDKLSHDVQGEHIAKKCDEILALKEHLEKNKDDKEVQKVLVQSFFENSFSEDHKTLCALMQQKAGIDSSLLKEYETQKEEIKKENKPIDRKQGSYDFLKDHPEMKPSAPLYHQQYQVKAPDISGLVMPNVSYNPESLGDIKKDQSKESCQENNPSAPTLNEIVSQEKQKIEEVIIDPKEKQDTCSEVSQPKKTLFGSLFSFGKSFFKKS